jgi:hypothetical protein
MIRSHSVEGQVSRIDERYLFIHTSSVGEVKYWYNSIDIRMITMWAYQTIATRNKSCRKINLRKISPSKPSNYTKEILLACSDRILMG